MTRQLRIAVCIPSHNAWTAPFGLSLARMLIHFGLGEHVNGKPAIEVFNSHGCVLPEVRSLLVAEALKWEATHMLFLDADMLFPPDTLLKLLRHQVLVVGANYVRRGLPTFPTAYLPGGMRDKSGILWTEPGDHRLVEVAHVGTGVMLIDMRVFECIEWPWFNFEPPAMAGPNWRTDDVYFCRKLREAQLPIYCDQELSQDIGHVGELVYRHQQALDCRAEEQAAAAAAVRVDTAPALLAIPDAAGPAPLGAPHAEHLPGSPLERRAG